MLSGLLPQPLDPYQAPDQVPYQPLDPDQPLDQALDQPLDRRQPPGQPPDHWSPPECTPYGPLYIGQVSAWPERHNICA